MLSLIKSEDYLKSPIKQSEVLYYKCKINQWVYNLYSLTEEEIGIVEGKK